MKSCMFDYAQTKLFKYFIRYEIIKKKLKKFNVLLIKWFDLTFGYIFD